MRQLLAPLVMAIGLTGLAHAQSVNSDIVWRVGETETATMKVETLKIDLNSPTVPAGAIIGADDIALTTVRSSSDLTSQLLSGFDENGVLQAGLAIGGNPYLWTNPRDTLKDYRDEANSLVGILKRTQLGIATKQIPGDDSNGVGVGVSVSWQLFAGYDLRQSKEGYTCLEKALKRIEGISSDMTAIAAVDALKRLKGLHANLAAMQPEDGLQARYSVADAKAKFNVDAPPGQETVTVNFILNELGLYDSEFKVFEAEAIRTRGAALDLANFKQERQGCDKTFTDYMATQDSLVLTVAQGFVSVDGKYENLETDKAAVYLQYRTGSNNPIQNFAGVPLIGLASYVTDETVRVSDTVEEKADRFVVGLGTTAEGEDQALDFQVSFAKSDFQTSRPDAEEFKASVSYSRKISKGIWVELKAGTKSSDDVSDDSFAGVSFKFSPGIFGS